MILTKDKVLNDLNQLIDKKYQEFSKKLSPDTNYKVLGIRVPYLRKLVKTYKDYDVTNYLLEDNFTSMEECQLYGMILNNQKLSFDEYKPYLENTVINIKKSCRLSRPHHYHL